MQIQIDLHTECSPFCILIVLSPRCLWVCFISSLPLSTLWLLCLHDFMITSVLQHTAVNRNNISPWNLGRVCLWVSWPPSCTSAQGTATTTPPAPLFLWEESSGAQLRWSLQNDSAGADLSTRGSPPTRCYIMSQHQNHAKGHSLYFWTCQCQPKRQIRKCHGSSHCPAFCSPNSEKKVRLMKIFSRVFLHLCYKKSEKPKEPSTLLVIY